MGDGNTAKSVCGNASEGGVYVAAAADGCRAVACLCGDPDAAIHGNVARVNDGGVCVAGRYDSGDRCGYFAGLGDADPYCEYAVSPTPCLAVTSPLLLMDASPLYPMATIPAPWLPVDVMAPLCVTVALL